jgi:beta-N-acetylhexosaminidase
VLLAALALAAPGAARTGEAARDGAAAGTGPTLQQLAGQAIMTGIDGAQPSAALLSRIRAGEVGGVILFGRNTASVPAVSALVRKLQAEAAAGGNPPLLIATDQEGGVVKRLPGPPDLSPSAMARAGTATAQAQGEAAGRYLRRLGIDVDLAPVLDTPISPADFIYSRAFSTDPAVNASVGTAFARGLQLARVAATAKHFPGLGTATTSTDTARVAIRRSKADLDRRLRPFAAAVAAGVKLVMVSNAAYPAYDRSGTIAVLSKPIVSGVLRTRLGFKGVVISDALETPGPQAQADAAVQALAAGVDVLLYTGEAGSRDGYEQLLAAARSGRLPVADLRAAAARTAALKGWLAHR